MVAIPEPLPRVTHAYGIIVVYEKGREDRVFQKKGPAASLQVLFLAHAGLGPTVRHPFPEESSPTGE